MLTFILVLLVVFIGVELLVRFVIDPLAAGSNKKNKLSKAYTPRFDPSIRLASETMYDGGELHSDDKQSKTKDEQTSKDASLNNEQ